VLLEADSGDTKQEGVALFVTWMLCRSFPAKER